MTYSYEASRGRVRVRSGGIDPGDREESRSGAWPNGFGAARATGGTRTGSKPAPGANGGPALRHFGRAREDLRLGPPEHLGERRRALPEESGERMQVRAARELVVPGADGGPDELDLAGSELPGSGEPADPDADRTLGFAAEQFVEPTDSVNPRRHQGPSPGSVVLGAEEELGAFHAGRARIEGGQAGSGGGGLEGYEPPSRREAIQSEVAHPRARAHVLNRVRGFFLLRRKLQHLGEALFLSERSARTQTDLYPRSARERREPGLVTTGFPLELHDGKFGRRALPAPGAKSRRPSAFGRRCHLGYDLRSPGRRNVELKSPWAEQKEVREHDDTEPSREVRG